MRIIYANGWYKRNRASGGNVHIYQFIRHAAAMGHEVFTWAPDEHPDARHVPANRFSRLALLRRADVIYVRLEAAVPGMAHWTLPPYRWLISSTPIVWEFNTAPEFALLCGKSSQDVERTIAELRHYGRGVDLACCVSQSLSDYVRENLGIARTLVVPNGSDPEFFCPDAPPVRRVERDSDRLNVVWIGSADIPWHNFALLRDAAQILWDRERARQIVFHLLGQGHGLMRDMPPNVHYYGPDDYQAMPHWLAAMDVGLVLYRPRLAADNGSPMKLFDYMASELAVVATYHPQVLDILTEIGQADLLVSPDDPEALISALLKLQGDRALLERLGRAGRQLIIDKYNWRRAVTDTLAEIERICREKGRDLRHISRKVSVSEPQE